MWLWLSLSAHAADGSEVRASIGGVLETQPNAAIDVGWRNERWSVQGFTDTLDARFRQEGTSGRWNLGVRVGAVAAGLFLEPWTGGAPDVPRGVGAGYAGIDGEAHRYLPHGLYVGAIAFVRPHWFFSLPATAPDAHRLPFTGWGQAQGTLGWWTEAVQARVVGGVDVTLPGRVSPHLRVDGVARIGWVGTQWWAGMAAQTDELTATRLGGLTPYHVPFSGASWAEFWVEDYAVARVAAHVPVGPVDLRAHVDAGAWTPPSAATTRRFEPMTALGLGLGAEVRTDAGWFGEVMASYSPTLPRAPGVWPVPVWLVVGREWTRLTAKPE